MEDAHTQRDREGERSRDRERDRENERLNIQTWAYFWSKLFHKNDFFILCCDTVQAK